MKKKVMFLLIGIFFLINIYFVNAVTNVTGCGVLNVTNEIYELNVSLSSSFDCITINATNITLDCMNYNISFGNATGGFGIIVGERERAGFNNITIRNCYLIQNESGVNDSAIFLGPNSENIVIFNNTIENYGEETLGIMVGDESVNANISSNRIYTNGTGNAGGTASGIEMSENGTNAVIEDNMVIIVGGNNSGIFLRDSVSETTIYNNVIWIMGNRTISDNAMGGIVLDQNTYDLNVSSNFIISGGSLSLIAEETEEDVDLTLENWTMAGGGYDTAGIWVWGDNSTIDNNLIISFGELGNGIFLNSVEGINITSNIIVTLGEQGDGILSEMSENASRLFYNNLIGTFGENSSGIHLTQDWYSNLSSNNISTLGNYSHGVFFNQSSNITFTNNIIETGESTSYTLYLNTSAGNLIYNNLFNTSTNDSGVFINNSDMSDFNTTKTSGINIVGKSYIGGNYWTNVDGTGYSDDCTESNGDYICDSSYDLETGGSAIDYLPLTLTTSYAEEDSDSPGSSGGGYPTFRPTEEELKNGYTKFLYRNWKISFKVENVSHIFKVENVNATNSKISISSETQEATLSVGEEKKFDLSGDDSYDLQVKLNSIDSSKANFTLQTIHELPESENGENGESFSEKIDILLNEDSSLKWIFLAVIIILIGILLSKGRSMKRSSRKK